MKGLIPSIQTFMKRHGPTVLTWASAAGVIGTTVAAVAATPKALRIIEKEEQDKGEKLTPLEVIKAAGHVYIPSILIGASTIACIFGANVLNKRQQAALTTLYSLADSAYKSYREKTKEIAGEDTDREVVRSIAEDNYNASDIMGKQEGENVYFDFYSLQYFCATPEVVAAAEKYVNDTLHTRGYATLADFYSALGLTTWETDQDLGWSIRSLQAYSGLNAVIFNHDVQITRQGAEIHIIEPAVGPVSVGDDLF